MSDLIKNFISHPLEGLGQYPAGFSRLIIVVSGYSFIYEKKELNKYWCLFFYGADGAGSQ
jgi:hypothetical protein